METAINTKLLRAGAAAITEAADILRHGGLVAFPTETVYGLGADATNGKAVAAIFAAKGRPQFNPLIVHVKDLAQAGTLVRFSPAASWLAELFWPGALTLVLPRRRGSPVSLLVSAGLETIALRVPAHPVAQRLLVECGLPVAAPSANRSSRISATTASHVADELRGKVDLIIDGGPAALGIEFDDRGIRSRPAGLAAAGCHRARGDRGRGRPASQTRRRKDCVSRAAAKPLRATCAPQARSQGDRVG